MFSLSGDFIIQMLIKSTLILLGLCLVFFVFKRFTKKLKFGKYSFFIFFVICVFLIFSFNACFVLNARKTLEKINKEIEDAKECKIVNSHLNPEAENYQKSEIKLPEDAKISLIQILSNQEYQLEPYGYSLATLEYLKIDVANEGYIQIIGDNFVAFKYGIFQYRCTSRNKELLSQIRQLISEKD